MAVSRIRQVSYFDTGRDGVDPVPAGAERLSEVAYRKILEGLFSRRLPAGAFLSQNDLVKLIDVPVQPLRDALRTLEAEGVVTIHPRSGIEFLKPDLELVRSTYQFRAIIERAAARSYAEKAKVAEIEQLSERHAALTTIIENEGLTPEALEQLESLDQDLHASMIRSLRNPLIETTARRLKNYLALIRVERRITKSLALRTIAEHVEILEAFGSRDPDRAEAALILHFQAATQRILEMF